MTPIGDRPANVGDSDTSTAPRPQGDSVPVSLRSDELLRGQREISILHGGDVYRLRITRNGKLILTK